ncbi:MAG: hypothetical protein IPJ69_01715 [Deltaproteobacteria bacterium]|nr:MAG: hypothetical protein IPJ69_01715 [Deltaproteobacteria bacterium]
MKKYLALFFLFGFFGCNATGGTETGNPTDSVALAMASSVDVVSSSIGADANTLTALTLNSQSALRGSHDGGLESARSCDSDDDVETEIECAEDSHEASIVRNFGTGCSAAPGVTVTGEFFSSWSNMGTGACANSLSRPQLFDAVQGSGSRQIVSTGMIASNNCSSTPTTAVTRTFAGGTMRIRSCRRFDYSGHASSGGAESFQESLTINNENRIRLKTNGETLFDHTLSTPLPLVFTVSKLSGQILPRRSLRSGVVSVSHNIAGYTVTSTFSDLEYDYATCRCHPVSGDVDIEVTDTVTGETLGTGQISFTETTTGVCDSTTATYNGSAVSLTLGSCRGF